MRATIDEHYGVLIKRIDNDSSSFVRNMRITWTVKTNYENQTYVQGTSGFILVWNGVRLQLK